MIPAATYDKTTKCRRGDQDIRCMGNDSSIGARCPPAANHASQGQRAEADGSVRHAESPRFSNYTRNHTGHQDRSCAGFNREHGDAAAVRREGGTGPVRRQRQMGGQFVRLHGRHRAERGVEIQRAGNRNKSHVRKNRCDQGDEVNVRAVKLGASLTWLQR